MLHIECSMTQRMKPPIIYYQAIKARVSVSSSNSRMSQELRVFQEALQQPEMPK